MLRTATFVTAAILSATVAAQELLRDDMVRTLEEAQMPAAGSAEKELPTRDGIDESIVTGAIMTERDMLQYCVNVQDSAREARYAFLKSKLDESQLQLEEKLVQLTGKLEEIREYVERRERFLAAVEDQVTNIFQTMRADAAAEQLSELETGLAASIIARLDAKTSSQILTEMAPRDAAAITHYLSAATKDPNGERAMK